MVGGEVVDKWIWGDGKVEIVVEGTGSDKGIFLQQDVEKSPYAMSIDRQGTLWWQSDSAYWTPRDKSAEDVKLARFGRSYAAHGSICHGRRMWNEANRMHILLEYAIKKDACNECGKNIVLIGKTWHHTSYAGEHNPLPKDGE